MKNTTALLTVLCFFVTLSYAQNFPKWDYNILLKPTENGLEKIGYAGNQPLTMKVSRQFVTIKLPDGTELLKADVQIAQKKKGEEMKAKTTTTKSIKGNLSEIDFLYVCATNGPGEITLKIDGEILFINLKKGWKCTNHTPTKHTCDKLPVEGTCGTNECIWAAEQ